ncbi:hypothetical protein [Pseudoruminococcus massiliensis]|uniref:hypothetical protein n=1 Tax=Pseudoruminococcus massiliensis TaxID=2086583 RepID=UPI0022E4641D|nr:hypothetical protein [Pseudoruminococcus massiliensis]
MKSEDLLKAIGNIDDKFIEEAAPKINAVNETNTAESNDSAKTDDKKLVEVVKVKPRSTFRIVASIAACVCVAAAVSFAIIGSTKFKPQVGDNGSCSSDGVCAKGNNNKEEIYNSLESKYDSENSKNNTSSVEASSSESSNSAELSNTDIPDNYFCAGSKKITSSDVKAIKAGMTYKEIINQLGETANFGQGNIRQYIVDDKLVLPLRFDSLSDVCKKTGEELLKQAISYKVPERIKDKLNDNIYAVVINDKFISCINGEPDNCCTIDLSDAEIKFENGKTATAADVKPMSSVLISYDMVAESYPGSMHCLKVTILDSNS